MHFPTIFLAIFIALTVTTALPTPTNFLSPFTNSSSPLYPLSTTTINTTTASTSLTLLSITTTLNTTHYFTTALTPRDLKPDGSVETGSAHFKHHRHPDQSDRIDIPYEDMTSKQHPCDTKDGPGRFIADGYIHVPDRRWDEPGVERKWHLLHPRGFEEDEKMGKVVLRPLTRLNGTGTKPLSVFKLHLLAGQDVFPHTKHIGDVDDTAIAQRDNGTWAPLHLFMYHPALDATHQLRSDANGTRLHGPEKRGNGPVIHHEGKGQDGIWDWVNRFAPGRSGRAATTHHEGEQGNGVWEYIARFEAWGDETIPNGMSEIARMTGGKMGKGERVP